MSDADWIPNHKLQGCSFNCIHHEKRDGDGWCKAVNRKLALMFYDWNGGFPKFCPGMVKRQQCNKGSKMKLKSLLIVGMLLLWSAVGYAEENILNVPDKQVNVDRIFYNADMLVQEKSATGKEYQPNCIPEDIAIKAWGVTLDIYKESINIGGLNISTTECDPCKCPTNGMEACYRFMAEKEKLKVEAYQISSKLLELAKRYGICK